MHKNINKRTIKEGIMIKKINKTSLNTRESSLSSNNSAGSHKRANSSMCESKPQLPIRHQRTLSSLNPFTMPTIQEELKAAISILQEKHLNEQEKFEQNKKTLKCKLMNAINNDPISSTIPKKRKLEKILSFFFPSLSPTEKLSDLYMKTLKTFFVAISKHKTFAVYCKDSGSWKKLYGDDCIKVTKKSAGTKLKFAKGSVRKTKPNESYNLFVLK